MSTPIERLCLAIALDNCHTHPESIQDASGNVTHRRTPFQNGWNAAISDILSNSEIIANELSKMDPLFVEKLMYLVDNGILHITDNGTVYWIKIDSSIFKNIPFLTERVGVIDIAILEDLHKKHQMDGVNAWIAVELKSVPIEKAQTNVYRLVKSSLEHS